MGAQSQPLRMPQPTNLVLPDQTKTLLVPIAGAHATRSGLPSGLCRAECPFATYRERNDPGREPDVCHESRASPYAENCVALLCILAYV